MVEEEVSKQYLGKIIKRCIESESEFIDEKEKANYKQIYRKFLKQKNID